MRDKASGVSVNIQVLQIETPSLGNRSYVIHNGHTGIVIDPQRDIDRIETMLEHESIALVAVAETHVHNDYLTGGFELARKFDVPYILNENTEVTFERFAIRDQETFVVGDFAVKAINTPGHTFDHVAYLVLDSNEQIICIATGGSLLHGSTGRPDLLGWEYADELAGLQFDSARHISVLVPDDVSIYPTHGFGSFCSATPTVSDASSIGDQKRINPVLLQKKSTYIRETLSHLDVYPKYFDLMAPINSHGPGPIALTTPTRLSSDEVERHVDFDAWVVDLRSRKSWTVNHLKGSTNIGLDGPMASYVGWLLPLDQKLILISDNESDISTAVRELGRIGIDDPIGFYVGDFSDFKNTCKIESVKFSDIEEVKNSKSVTILDVRQNLERQKSHIAKSVHIPFYEVQSRMSEIPLTGEVWVHCASGYRAALVLGAIECSGRTVVLIDDDFVNAAEVAALEIVEDRQD
jgi:glyoxylase-like metal-dependent hydrolase (beta-lactamase superfamily II)/rhodanese-related sulfurtransferase